MAEVFLCVGGSNAFLFKKYLDYGPSSLIPLSGLCIFRLQVGLYAIKSSSEQKFSLYKKVKEMDTSIVH